MSPARQEEDCEALGLLVVAVAVVRPVVRLAILVTRPGSLRYHIYSHSWSPPSLDRDGIGVQDQCSQHRLFLHEDQYSGLCHWHYRGK